MEPWEVPMDLPVESPSVANPFMEQLRTLKSPGVHPWGRPFSSAAASLSCASLSSDLLTPHLTIERLEADASVAATSLEEESAGRVASKSSSGTSISSTSSSASSASSTQLVAYRGIDVETASALFNTQSYDKSPVMYDSTGIRNGC